MKPYFISVKDCDQRRNIPRLSRDAKQKLYGKYAHFAEAQAHCTALNLNKPDDHPGYIVVEECEVEELPQETRIVYLHFNSFDNTAIVHSPGCRQATNRTVHTGGFWQDFQRDDLALQTARAAGFAVTDCEACRPSA